MNGPETYFPPVDYALPVPDANDALNDEITRLAGHINAATYRFLKLLAIQIERGAWAADGIKSPAHWLNYWCGITLGAARERVRVALRLDKLPQIDAAFKTGALSYSKVRAMTRVATPESERFLLQVARYGTASHMEKLVRKFESVERVRRRGQAHEIQEARELHWYYDDDGMLVFEGRLPPEEGARVIEAIQTVVEEEWARERREQRAREALKDSSREKDVSAETSTDQEENVSAETSTAENVSAETCLPEDRGRTYGQLRADALTAMAEHLLSTWKNGLGTSERHQVMVHIDVNQVRSSELGTLSRSDVGCYLEEGPFLAPDTVRRLACDAGLVPLLEDGEGQLLSIGRKSRIVPPALQRALKIRDGGCRYPGCTESRYVDSHHIVHWCDGGETSLQNLLLLCRHHHRMHHEGGYRILRTAQGEIRFIGPENRWMPPARYPQFPRQEDPLTAPLVIEREHVELGMAIDGHTARSRWRGEPIDYDDAVGFMWEYAHPEYHQIAPVEE